ncbi:DNA replication regulator sld2 [Chaetomidium leptoderma]|uniref:DNA replication regulator SLD2 n=1 Tax=Chaetomidium leptoderma TaxID=669021 RepID=A0AAN6ZZ65_9PEZI|nr:DNA replication regulator sld2 [Chaetomidium leptoderma]
MDDQARAAYEDQSLQLRAELKQWEGDWAIAHGGKKPGRDHIKQHPDIAHKYKQYSKLRDILAGKIPPPPPGPADATHGHQQQRKRTQSDAALPPQTPSKRSKPVQTPRKTQHMQPEAMSPQAQTPSAARVALTPSSNRTALTPAAAVPTSISPTPQRDGRVLGLFDLLVGTPSRFMTYTVPTIPLPAATPSKQRTIDLQPSAATTTTTPTTARFASTPKANKRTTQLLFQTSTTTPLHDRENVTPFKTPSTNRIAKPRSTPTSSTPSFLRRRAVSLTTTTTTTTSTTAAAALSRVDEQDEDADEAEEGEEEAWKKVGPLRLPRKLGIMRGLSSVVAGLRRMEEEAFEDEEEAMREMEMEAEGMVAGRKGGVTEVEVEQHSQGQVQLGRDIPGGMGDKQNKEPPVGLLSGFDNEAVHDDDGLDEGGRQQQQQQQQQPLRQFKKRGQKRTTRLVNMRPTRSKRPAAQTEGKPDDDKEDDDAASASEPDFDALDSNSDGNEEPAAAVKAKTKTSQKKAAASVTKDDAQGAKSEGVVKRAVRKVKASAHANFKRLKLRNSGSKGGPGHNSRFRRRR